MKDRCYVRCGGRAIREKQGSRACRKRRSVNRINDPISDILKWVLLVVAIICFGLMGWATVLTYEKAPPQPQAFTDKSGNVIMDPMP